MTQILRILLEVTIYSALLFAVVMLFKKLLRRHISPILGYAVWALLILRLMIPVTIDSGIKLFVIPEAVSVQQTQIADTQEKSGELILTGQAAKPVVDDAAEPVSFERPYTSPEDSLMVNESTTMGVNSEPSRAIDWQTALVMLWAAGMVVSAAILRLLFSRIRCKTAKGSLAPENIRQLVNTCKRDMGIRADIEVLILDWLETPALTASPKPKLLLPQSMLLNMDKRQIEYGIRHELMHYRHRDYLVALLLMLLRCVYWFNPVVWLATRQIETDMETACDVSVTASLNLPERVDYAQTMIDLGSKASAYMLGMGLPTGRRSMEKRVRGIFMEKRSKLSVKLASLVLCGLLIFTCFTTACQPVQSQPVDNAAAAPTQTETAQALAEPTSTPSPEPNPNEGYGSFPDWVETYSIPYLNVDINAQIVTPETDVFPLYKVQKREFDDETLQKIIDYFADDIVGVREFSFTEDELKEQLKYMNKHDAKQTDYIKELKTQIAAAQPEVFTPIDKNTTLNGNLIFQTEDGGRVNFMVSEDWCTVTKYTGNYSMQYEEWVKDSGWPHLFKPMAKTLEASKITDQKAIDLAQKALMDMGIEDMGVIAVDRAVIVNTCLDDFPSGGWHVSFGRTVNGSVPADLSFQDSRHFNFREKDYFERWQDETLGIYVDDGGVQSITWGNPKVVTEVAEENVALMPWDKAQQAIRDAMSLGYSNLNRIIKEHGGEVRETNVAADKIVLTNVLVPQGDDLDYQLMVPTWVVYHQDVWEYEGQKYERPTEIFAVNAIDGSVIDLTYRTHEMDQK